MDETTQAAQAAQSANGIPPTPAMPPEVAQILTGLADIRIGLQANQAALGIIVGINVMVLVAVIVSTRKLLAVP